MPAVTLANAQAIQTKLGEISVTLGELQDMVKKANTLLSMEDVDQLDLTQAQKTALLVDYIAKRDNLVTLAGELL